MKRRITSILLVLLTVLSLSTAAMAAEAPAELPVMELEWRRDGTTAFVDVYLTAAGATNGRLTVGYSDAVLTLKTVNAANSSWITSIDRDSAGEVAFAWVGSKLTSAKTLMLTLGFNAPADSFATTVTAALSELYAGTAAFTLGDRASAFVYMVAIPGSPVVGPVAPGQDDGGADDDNDDTVTPVAFTDIVGHWAEKEIMAAYKAGLVNGVGNGRFAPDAALDRAMFVTLLYRLAGEPAVSGSNPFADVAAGQYYEKAVIWAYENNIVTGTGADSFSPGATLTREQMVTMLYRYAAFAGLSTEESAPLAAFDDSASVSPYAIDAMQWAVGSGLIKGQGNALVSAGTTTRAQAATVLVRFVD